jgi:hypothetical protein
MLYTINPETIKYIKLENDEEDEDLCNCLTDIITSYKRNQLWKNGDVIDLKYGIGQIYIGKYPLRYKLMIKNLCKLLTIPYSDMKF